MRMQLAVHYLFIFLCVTNCKKDDEKKSGKSIGAPEIQPPVTRNMPSGFKDASLLLDSSSDLQAIKDYLYPSSGFVGPMERLEKIDERMAELNARAEESEKVCLNSAAETFAIGGTLPGSTAFPLYFQCQETLTGTSGTSGVNKQMLAFGIKTSNLYLMEHAYQSDGGAIVVMAKAAMSGKSTEVMELRYSETDHRATYLHLLGSDAKGFELSMATGPNPGGSIALDCGVKVKSDGSFIKASVSSFSNDSCQTATEYCVKAGDLTVQDAGDCDGLGAYSLTEITPANIGATFEDAKAIAAKDISGFIDFTKAVEVTDESNEE